MKIISGSKIAVAIYYLLASQSTLASPELDYALGLEVGLRNAEFEVDAIGAPATFTTNTTPSFTGTNPGSKSHVEFEEILYIVGFSGSLIYDQFHLTGLVEFTPETADTDVEISSVFNEGANTPDQSADRSADLDRFDFSVTLGYHVWDGLSVFSGYRYSKFELRGNEYNYLQNNKDPKYSEEGLFVGSNYAWEFGSIGSLSLSVAYAFLDADYSEDNVDLTAVPPPGNITFGELAFDGTAKGLSFGVQWSGPFVDEWVYKVGLKYQSYKSNNNSTTIETFAPGITTTPTVLSDIDTKHSDTTFTVGIAYVFQ